MKKKIALFSVLWGIVSATCFGQYASVPVYLDENKPIEERVEDALSRMTVEEKVAMCHAQSKFSSKGVPRLGIPENWMSDGPHGIREEVLWDEWGGARWTNDSCTAFPALTCLAATWNPQMSYLYGQSIGQEARYRNKNVLLGPGVNIYRTPLNGRNFEYMGEDPYLASVMVVPYVRGVQENNVAACVKHFALNNQEFNRHRINVQVDDRALYEIYLPAFEAAVRHGNAWAIMGAYNKYQNQFCCHNERLLMDILKGEWGFDGVVVSDWGGVEDTREAILNGLDMEFGTNTDGLFLGRSNDYANYHLADSYLELLRRGEVGTKELDDKVRRILRLVFRTNMAKDRRWGSFATDRHAAAGRKIAEEGMVLLKNEKNTLPVDLDNVRRIVVVGDNACRPMTIGGGSSSLKARYEVSPLEGIRRYVKDSAEIVYERGYVAKNKYDRQESDSLRSRAVDEARNADVVIFVGGLNKKKNQDSEGNDRLSYSLPYHQDELISELVSVNPNTVVVMVSGNAVAMPWERSVPAVLQAWYGGSEAGNALARILFGDVNPSGKMPFSVCRDLNDYACHAMDAYTATDTVTQYKESIFVGYRYTDKEKIKPLFPFGHGLSYTEFEYGKPSVDRDEISENDSISVSVRVKNIGERAGQEVVQLYIRDKKSYLPRPNKELKGFRKIALDPGQEKVVIFTIGKDALSFFDDSKHRWVAEPGEFEACVGSSSSDIRGKVSFKLK